MIFVSCRFDGDVDRPRFHAFHHALCSDSGNLLVAGDIGQLTIAVLYIQRNILALQHTDRGDSNSLFCFVDLEGFSDGSGVVALAGYGDFSCASVGVVGVGYRVVCSIGQSLAVDFHRGHLGDCFACVGFITNVYKFSVSKRDRFDLKGLGDGAGVAVYAGYGDSGGSGVRVVTVRRGVVRTFHKGFVIQPHNDCWGQSLTGVDSITHTNQA